MKKIIFILFLSLSHNVFLQVGGNTCSIAQTYPLTLGSYYSNQSTCGNGNDFTGGVACLSAPDYAGLDYLYYFCAPTNGCLVISMPNTHPMQPYKSSNASMVLFDGCPGAGGNCLASSTEYIEADSTASGAYLSYNLVAGACYYLLIDSRSGGMWSNCMNFDLSTNFTPSPQLPGGNSCLNAQSEQITIGNTYTNQSTCCMGNQYTGANNCNGTGVDAYAYGGQDYLYYFCATQTGCVTIELNDISAGIGGKSLEPILSVFQGCPFGGGSCLASISNFLLSGSSTDGPSISLNVVTGTCYYILIESSIAGGYANCYNYSLRTSYQTPLTQLPGGNDCSTALSNQIQANTSYAMQTTSCGGNDYQVSNACLSSDFYEGNDWVYTYCAVNDGEFSVDLSLVSSEFGLQSSLPTLSVFDACPGMGGTCLTSSTSFIPSNQISNGPSVTLNVLNGQCYYVLIDASISNISKSKAFNYQLNTHFRLIENCTNAIDDDGDGLIDLNDNDCSCSGQFSIASYISNPSFESIVNCPSYFSQANYASGWQQASTMGTADYFNSCGYISNAALDAGIFPFPNGQAAMGTIVTDSYKEFLGTCLNTPLTAGVSYTFNFNLASTPMDNAGNTCNGGSIFYGPLNINIYGSSNCANIPFNGFGCVPGSWQVLGTLNYTPSTNWNNYSITFTPSTNINAVIIGSSCTLTADYTNGDCLPYFYYDNLLLNQTTNFNVNINQVGTYCQNDLTLNALTNISGGTWNYNNIALTTQQLSNLEVSNNGLPDGTYTTMYNFNDECIKNSITIAPCPLPVTLTNFQVETKYDKVLVLWNTESEFNNDYFIILRSKDYMHWEELKKVKGKGNSNLKQAYEWLDEQPYDGLSYYKLLQVDRDGTRTDLGIQTVSFNKTDQLLVFPTVFNANLNVVLPNEKNQIVFLTINDSYGKMVYKGSLEQKNNTIDLSHLTKGIYLMNISTSNEDTQYKIIKN